MKKIYVFTLFILFTTIALAQSPNWLWAKSNGGNLEEKALSMATDNAGNLYVAGYFDSPSITFGTTTLNNSSRDMFLVKYDGIGNVLWAKGTGGNANGSFANSVTVDASGNVYVVGRFYSSTITFGTIILSHPGMFIVKYDSSGNVRWAKDCVNSGSVATAIVSDEHGSIFIGGSLTDTLFVASDTLLPLQYNRFIAKYDTAGNPLWARGMNTFGITTDVDEPFIAADKFGNIYVTGGFHLNICTIVNTYLINQGNYNIYIAKFNSLGNLEWAKRYGSSGSDQSTSIDTDTSGNIYLTGCFTSTNITFDSFTLSGGGTIDFVVKLDSSCTTLWAKRFGRMGFPAPPKLAVDKSDNVFVTGYFSSSALAFTSGDSLTNKGLFLAKYGANGDFYWARDAIGGSRATSIALNSAGNPYIAGYFGSDSLIFDSSILLNDSTPGFDFFVASIDLSNSVKEIKQLNKNFLSVFPNPTQGKFYVMTQNEIQNSIHVYDSMGKEIFSKTINHDVEYIDLSASPKGIYLVTSKNGCNIYSKKIVII